MTNVTIRSRAGLQPRAAITAGASAPLTGRSEFAGCVRWRLSLSALRRMWFLEDGSVGVLVQYPLGGAVEILVLAALERPHEGRECDQAKAERDRYQIEIVDHSAAPRTGLAENRSLAAPRSSALRRPLRRSALATTAIDDADIAIAAINGVTWPMIATGMAMAL